MSFSSSTSLSVAARALCVPVRLYQAVRAGRPSPCRYWPTCSQYAIEALEAHGAVRGSWLAGRRLLRCHPLSRRSGVDPVPSEQAGRARRPRRRAAEAPAGGARRAGERSEQRRAGPARSSS